MNLDHRAYVGNPAEWSEHAKEQITFFREKGLEPYHDFLDIGCGPLRGGSQFIPYLDEGKYCGIEMNKAILEAGIENEMPAGVAEGKDARFCISDSFPCGVFHRKFDFVNAYQIFQHNTLPDVKACFAAVRKVLKSDGKFFFTLLYGPEVNGRPYSNGIDELVYPKSVKHSMFKMKEISIGFNVGWEGSNEPHRWCLATLVDGPY